MAKLQEKRQSVQQQNQAKEAILLFYGLQAEFNALSFDQSRASSVRNLPDEPAVNTATTSPAEASQHVNPRPVNPLNHDDKPYHPTGHDYGNLRLQYLKIWRLLQPY
ncbi:hypothetical protein [methane-oxidizing endosymbiont of Gigantopelta aegis]|uniref:hypothetical protein n=1 Tax=methane-oxidizing endosymbiont of Gigantopelta aegis TaxID=2794938 RepID=UPI0018DD4B25|nr:hypothetical protein [methane-oxidizing endosymbiont of Gigantopelta aegis]